MNTTVAAVSTPYGKGGVALIRISGEQAIAVAEKVFLPCNRKPLSEQPHARLTRGDITDGESIIDDGMAAVFFAPHSYTGEDVVEITCHGGILLTQKVLEAVMAHGAEAAGPGEFTRRAFLNGKLGLSQAEAVIDLIDAESEEKIRLANAQNRGVLSRKTDALYEKILQAVSSVYAYVDFPDEDMTDFAPDELRSLILQILQETEALLRTYRTGHAVANGIRTVICGKPNTGKSSLLNRMLGQERAIVTDVAGTTRDTIEETAVIGRIMLRLCDTAGIRDTDDFVEQLGIERSKQKAREAELLLAVFDPSVAFSDADRIVLSLPQENTDAVCIALLNKTDLPALWSAEEVGIAQAFSAVLPVCCATGDGLDRLYETIEAAFVDGSLRYDQNAVLTNVRQAQSVRQTAEALKRAVAALDAGMTQDVAGMDLEAALAALGELDGRAVSEEVVHSIFHRFCVGK